MLFNIIYDDSRGLDQRMKQMVVEEQGRRVVLPAGEQFTLETIHDHFWMPVGTEGKPRGWEIDRAGKRYIYLSSCLFVVFNLSVPEYILTF